jgi:hypothetical protein
MLKLQLGAKRYRCAACRCNFASFKPCRDKTIWRRRDPGGSLGNMDEYESLTDD